MQETQVQSLDQEGPLEEDMAAHSSALAWRIPWTEEPGGLQARGLQTVWQDRGTEQQVIPKSQCLSAVQSVRLSRGSARVSPAPGRREDTP